MSDRARNHSRDVRTAGSRVGSLLTGGGPTAETVMVMNPATYGLAISAARPFEPVAAP